MLCSLWYLGQQAIGYSRKEERNLYLEIKDDKLKQHNLVKYIFLENSQTLEYLTDPV